MSEVWRAVHRDLDVAVAMKVMSVDERHDRTFRDAFRREVRAAAGLSHPNIVAIYDYGEVPESASRLSDGLLGAGAPYMVLELAPHGSLNRRRGRMPWPLLKRSLLCTLDALAHAHARGLIHRDLKPGNLLQYGEGQVKLTDFGLAHALSTDDPVSTGGTPTYMAPEQFTNRWRDYGPWTDLYGLGVLAWVLSAGQPPFGDPRDVQGTMRGHLHQDPGAFEPQVAVADGFEAWLRELLRKDPAERFKRAADAAWALRGLADPGVEGSVMADDDPRDRVPMPELATVLREPPLSVQDTVLYSTGGRAVPQASSDDASERDARPPSHESPPLPRDPQRLQAAPPPWLTGTGPSLYGLREVPLIGRGEEQRLLWGALVDVHALHEVRLVVLKGPQGCGKSRLARWLCERAHETGGATVWQGTHDSGGGVRQGIRGMLVGALRCGDLAPARLWRRLRRLALPEELCGPLADWLAPEMSRDLAGGSRDGAVLQLMELTCAERPLVLWLDDVHHGSTSLSFVRRLLAAQAWSGMPVLVVMTAQDEALAERSQTARQLEQLEALPPTSLVRIEPLQPAQWPQLVRELLPLEPGLAARVEQRTAGHPLFAVQLLGEWVASGQLQLGEHGYRLEEGAALRLPDDLHQVWSDRLERLLSERPPAWTPALELAAVLGGEVNGSEWQGACTALGIELPESMLDALVTARLAVVPRHGSGYGFTFAHSMLRAALERRAADAGRLPAAHRACAAMLEGRDSAVDMGRRAQHRVGAGDLEGALDDFFVAATSGPRDEARWLVDLVAAWDDAAPAPSESDPRRSRQRAEGWAVGARAARMCGRTVEARRWGDACDGLARRLDFDDLLARVLEERAALASDLGQLDVSRELYDEALAAAVRSGDGRVRLAIQLRVAQLMLEVGRVLRARALFEEVRAGAAAVPGAELFAARASVSLGSAMAQEGSVREGIDTIQQGLAVLEAQATPWDRAQAHNLLAEAQRANGALEGAEQSYRTARVLMRSQGAWTGVFAELNLALVGFARGRFAPHLSPLLRILAWSRQDGRPTVEAMTRVCLLRIVAELGRWESFDEHLAALRDRLTLTRMVVSDVALQALEAGEAARRAGENSRAIEGLHLAQSQFMALGRDVDHGRVTEILRTMTRS